VPALEHMPGVGYPEVEVPPLLTFDHKSPWINT
jgi:hypothetical protein